MSEIYSFPDDDTSMDEWISNDVTSPTVGWNAIVFMTGSSNEDCAGFKDKLYKLRSVIGEIRYERLINGNCYQCNEKTCVCLKEKKFKLYKQLRDLNDPSLGMKKYDKEIEWMRRMKHSLQNEFSPDSRQYFTTKFVVESLRRFETSIEWNW